MSGAADHRVYFLYGTNKAIAAKLGTLASGSKWRLQRLDHKLLQYDTMASERALKAAINAMSQQYANAVFIEVREEA